MYARFMLHDKGTRRDSNGMCSLAGKWTTSTARLTYAYYEDLVSETAKE